MGHGPRLPSLIPMMKALHPFLLLLAAALATNGDEPNVVCDAENPDATSCSSDIIRKEHQQKQTSFICRDLDDSCSQWSKLSLSETKERAGNACQVNSAYMTQKCPISCSTCEIVYLGYRLSQMVEGGLSVTPFCQDNNFHCRQFALDGECEKNPGYMNSFCEASCGHCSEARCVF